jgi:FG-GAP repeat
MPAHGRRSNSITPHGRASLSACLRFILVGVAALAVMLPVDRGAISAQLTSSSARNSDGGPDIEQITGDIFSYTLAVSGDTLVVGAPYDDTPDGANAGSVYVFVRSLGQWSLQATLTSPDPSPDDIFGRSVDIDGDTLVVGDPLDDRPEGADAGSAYVFVRNGTTWLLQATLSHPTPAAMDVFGRWTAISGDTIVVAAPFDDTSAGTDAGSVFVFVRSGTEWSLQQTLNSPEARLNNRFGKAIDIDGDTLIVGEPHHPGPHGERYAGAAYVFVRSGTTWSLQATLAHPSPYKQDLFGRWVSVDGDTALITAPNDNTPQGVNSGSAFVFVRSGSTWTLQASLLPSGDATQDRFGLRAIVQGDIAAIGAPYDATDAGAEAGTAYVFARSGTTWSLQSMMASPTPAAYDHFGRGFGLEYPLLVVAEPNDDAEGPNGGAAHTFTPVGSDWVFSDTVIDPNTTPP